MTESSRQSPDADAGEPCGGERLAAARRAHEISATDIAKELHLDERKVRALEQNDFAVLGAPVFAKGHLRKYAELVGVPVDDVIADYYKLNRSAGAPPVVGAVRKMPREYSPGPWLAGTVIVLFILGIGYWFISRGTALSLTQEAPANLATFVPNPGKVGPADEPATATEAVAGPRIVLPETPPDTIPADPSTALAGSAVVTDSDAASLAPQVQVELTFSGECWTEVTDASGRVIFYDLGSEGRAVTLSGDEPLSIVLGDFQNVSIAVQGRDFPIPVSARRGRLARLTINRQ